MKKNVLAILTASVFLVSFLAVAMNVNTAVGADPADWYMTVNGVLNTDKYSLYPYKKELLKLGLSKFGELIDDTTNVGLEYAGARDPFAPVAGTTVPPELQKNVWINGWFIDIRYNHSVWGYRNVWAGALFADIGSYGGPWLRVDNGYGSCTYEWQEAFNLPGKEINVANPGEVTGDLVNGGRKTNGTVLTDPIQVLYDGPRLFVAKITNHIYDWYEPTKLNRHMVDLVLTVIFNKVKKEVIVVKDVKLVPPAKFEVAPLKITVDQTDVTVPCGYLVQLSNREEWDLGTVYPGTTSYSSYVHFYRESEAQPTVYNRDWTMLPTLPAGVTIKGVTVNSYGNQPGSVGTYDVAQIISNDKKYVGWHAFWPSVSDWSVTAGDDGTWFKALSAGASHTIDGPSEPWRSPLIVGEWDFMLSDQKRVLDGGVMANVQFRAVSVYGVTDLNNGSDVDFDGSNVIDKEVRYQLNEIFNPWDLNDAVHKATSRDVLFVDGPISSGTIIWLDEPLVSEEWDAYCSFAERVILLPDGKLWKRGTEYVLWDEDEDDAYESIKLLTSVASGKTLKILYSTSNYWERAEPIVFEFFEEDDYLEDGDYVAWTDPLGVTHEAGVDDIVIIVEDYNSDVDFEEEFTWWLYGWERDFKVFKGSTYTCSWDYTEPMLQIGDYANVSLNFLDIHWYITAPATEDVHIWELGFEAIIDVTVSYNVTTEVMNITATVTLTPPEWYVGFDVLYSETIPGRYEWITVGRDARTVDSAGAALVSAAFKNKQVEIGLAGEDMYGKTVDMEMPWVMAKFGTGNTFEDYYYVKPTDQRMALKDDWCTTWPISSSNMIGVGGPLANALTYYFNDFVPAFYALPWRTAYTPWSGKVVPLTCWDVTKTRAYASSDTVGYGVISTYKDINGTVGFLIWGNWGRDTYYLTKWFHEEGIYQLQEAPEGLTAIIVEIEYEYTAGEGYKPIGYSIVECLGTISETLWTHNGEYKGGIHDP
ncbi:MAG: hypothetical protein QW146_07425 [Candidatus Bathyarchaeia archaeon]